MMGKNFFDGVLEIEKKESNSTLDVYESEEKESEEVDSLEYDISNYPSDITLKGYVDMFDSGQIIIPEFQRKYVWTLPQASKLIESFLIGLPVPNIFLFQKKDSSNFIVIDGNQRLNTINKFFKGKFDNKRVFSLKNVREKWSDKSFDSLDEQDKFKLQTSVLRAINVKQIDPKDDSSIYHIFERLNTGGVNLNPMEVRMCINESKFSNMLRELNKNENWRKLLKKDAEDNRLRDVEWILRFFALRELSDRYEKPMKKFLNKFLESKKLCSDSDIDAYKKLFYDTVGKACGLLKENESPFYRTRQLNYALLDSIMIALSSSNENIDQLPQLYQELISDQEYMSSISSNTSDVNNVKERIRLARGKLS